MTTWTVIGDYLPSLDLPLPVEGKPATLVKRLRSFSQAHELCLTGLGSRERQLIHKLHLSKSNSRHEPCKLPPLKEEEG